MVSAFKPLMESYKSQLDNLETKNSTLQRENDTLRHEQRRTESKLQSALVEKEKDSEALALYEERVRELELSGLEKKKKSAGGGTRRESGASESNDDDDQTAVGSVGGELDDAITGTTTTDLKLQVRKLQRELKAAQANKADSSRIVVLENLLEDANRMKSRYELDAQREHREKLVAMGRLEEILSGKSGLGDGCVVFCGPFLRGCPLLTDSFYIDRKRRWLCGYGSTKRSMNWKRFDDCRTSSTSSATSWTRSSPSRNQIVSFPPRAPLFSELTHWWKTVALVDKDQLDVLKTLRASVSVEKEGLVAELARARLAIREAEETKKLQLSQVRRIFGLFFVEEIHTENSWNRSTNSYYSKSRFKMTVSGSGRR